MRVTAASIPVVAAIGPAIFYFLFFCRVRISVSYLPGAVLFLIATLFDLLVLPVEKGVETVAKFSGPLGDTFLRALLLAALPEQTALISLVAATAIIMFYRTGDRILRGRQVGALIVALILGQAYGERVYRLMLDPSWGNVIIRTLSTIFAMTINFSIVIFVQKSIVDRANLIAAVFVSFLISLLSHTLLDATVFGTDYMFHHHSLGFAQDMVFYALGVLISIGIGVTPALPTYKRLHRLLISGAP